MAFSSSFQALSPGGLHRTPACSWHVAPSTPGAREQRGGPQLWHQTERERSQAHQPGQPALNAG